MTPESSARFASAAASNLSRTPIVWRTDGIPLPAKHPVAMISPTAFHRASERLAPHVASASHQLSSHTNVQLPLLPGAVVTGRNEGTSAGGLRPSGAGEAPGNPPPSGSATEGQVQFSSVFQLPTFPSNVNPFSSCLHPFHPAPGAAAEAPSFAAAFSGAPTLGRGSQSLVLPSPISNPFVTPRAPLGNSFAGNFVPPPVPSRLFERGTLFFTPSDGAQGAPAVTPATPHGESERHLPRPYRAATPSVSGSRSEASSVLSSLSNASTLTMNSSPSLLLGPSAMSLRSPPPPPKPNAFATSPLFQKAREVRRAYAEAKAARDQGRPLLDQDGNEPELAAPLALTSDFDAFTQRCILASASFIEDDSNKERAGVPTEHFEQAWEEAALALSPLIEEATGASPSEVSAALVASESDASMSLLTILHNCGDQFQQACASAAAVELRRRRQARSLEAIVQEAAEQGGTPTDLSSRKLLKMLQRHLPLCEIMGHRYRIDRSLASPERRVSFDRKSKSRRRSSSRDSARSDRSRSNSREPRRARSQSRDPSSSDKSRHLSRKRGTTDDDDAGSDSDDSDDSAGEDEGGSSDAFDSEFTDDDNLSEDSEESGRSSRSGRESRKRRERERSRGDDGDGSRSNLVATAPPDWNDGDPPKAGFYLDTFTNIYSKFRSFTRLHKSTGLRFKDLIQDDLRDTVEMELGLSAKQYKALTEEELLRRIKEELGFTEDDYFVRKLELLKLPPFRTATQMMKSFRKLTSPFLRIVREAKDSGVRIRFANLSRIFRNQIRGCPALERWFLSRRFKTFREAVKYVSAQIHDRVSKQTEEEHDDLISDGKVAGARSEIRGGKSESGQATPRGGQGRRNQEQPPSRPKSPAPNSATPQGSRPPRTDREEAAFQAAFEKEKQLPSGMYHHPHGPFCKETPCKAKICQGCNYHADEQGRGHIRPNCKCKDHPDFVKSGYFHDKHPGRTGALSLPRTPSASDQPRVAPPSKLRSVSGGAGRPATRGRRQDRPE